MKNKKEKSGTIKTRRDKIVEYIKLLIKDLKRSRWTDTKDNRKTFVKVAIFIVVISSILFGIALGFSALWNELGVGLNA